MGFLPFPALCPSRFCGDPECNLEAIAQDLVGSVLTLKVIFVDENEKRLIFSEAKATFMEHVDSINVGDTFDGRVGPVMDYGALVYLRFPDGKYYMKGLIHKSEISWDFVRNPGDFLTLGDDVRVMVTSIDREMMRIYLSLKQLEEDPLHETLDKVIHQVDTVSHSPSTTADYDIDPLPGLKEILIELLQEQGISDVIISRQGFERRVVSPDLQIWLSNAPAIDNQVTLLARAGRQVQEIQLTTSLDHNGVRKALQRALERVP